MPQMQLAMFPLGVVHITNELAVKREDDRVVYFNGHMPVFVHDVSDVRTFRMITSQFCVNGNAKQVDIARAFGIPLISVKRAVKRYREKGPKGFYSAREKRGPSILTPIVLNEVQQRLDRDESVKSVAEELDIKYDTLKKAVSSGRLKKKPADSRG